MTKRQRRNLRLQLYIVPAMLLIAVYLYYPIVDNSYVSLFDVRNFNLAGRVFVGLSNYARLIRDQVYWLALRNTALLTAAVVLVQLPVAFLLADALANHMRARHRRLEEWLTVVLFLPVVLPTPVLAKSWRLFFTGMHGAGYGPFQWITMKLGIEDRVADVLGTSSVLLLGEVKTAFWVVLGVVIWARIGFNLLIYRSAIMSIPAEIYESADIDGAGAWTKLFSLTVPLSRNVIGATIVLAILGVFQIFDVVWMMTEYCGPLNTTQVLATYMYTRAFRDLLTGYGAAIAMTILLASLALSLVQRRLFRLVD